tara:strand:+ start:264 stop:824 length:561 start_codon:yes stop_codon:yes gene_type:complete
MSENIKKLTLKHSYLVLESEEVKNICLSVEKELKKALRKKYPDLYNKTQEIKGGKQEEKIPSHQEEPEQEKETKNKDVKKLYRKIASKIHPDKEMCGDADKFAKAAKAYKEQDIGTLLEIAGEINIELFDLSEEALSLLKNSIISLENEIIKLKGTISWAWYNSSSEEEKDILIEKIVNHHGDKNA